MRNTRLAEQPFERVCALYRDAINSSRERIHSVPSTGVNYGLPFAGGKGFEEMSDLIYERRSTFISAGVQSEGQQSGIRSRRFWMVLKKGLAFLFIVGSSNDLIGTGTGHGFRHEIRAIDFRELQLSRLAACVLEVIMESAGGSLRPWSSILGGSPTWWRKWTTTGN